MMWNRLRLFWGELRLNSKLGISYGALLALLVMTALSGYLMLIVVQNKTQSALQVSMDIQRQVLEIKAGIERARKMQKDFFISWDRPVVTQAMVLSSRKVAGQIQEMKDHSRRLKELIAQAGFDSKYAESQINLNFFLSAADRFSTTFHEATTLRIAWMRLYNELRQHQEELYQGVLSARSPAIEAWFWQMQANTNEYLRSRERPNIQSAFNTAKALRSSITSSGVLDREAQEAVLQSLDGYLEAAREMLPLDVSLRSKFNEFDLQVEAVDPIIMDLMRIADQEMASSKDQIARTTWIAVSILFVTLAAAIVLVGIIAVILNRSITQNILELTAKAKDLRQGHLGVRMDITSADELGQLAEAFNTMAEQIQKQVDELQDLARTDQLTGVSNRHSFLQCLDFELKRIKRTGTPMSLLMCDIDHFKQINDTYGHGTGDEILKELVRVVDSNLREVDILARWGGEEFLILTPDTELASAQAMAERLRRTVAGYAFPRVGRITVSFGVAQYRKDDTTETLIARADGSMYLAKQKGRNTVEASD